LTLAEIPYPRINPDLLHLGPLTVRWYGVSYVVAFGLAYLVLHYLAKRDRWPVAPDRVADVLFWGIVGVFLGGRIGWVLFYGLPGGSIHKWYQVFEVWNGGMSFHGGLIGVIVAYWILTRVKQLPRGAFFDGLTLATPLGILCVRTANFVNAELYGRAWSGPWSMRFPRYSEFGGPEKWKVAFDGGAPNLFTGPRHPSQLYEAGAEGILLFLVLWWLMVKKGVGGGRIAASFLVGYGLIRFLLEFVRQPDADMGYVLFGFITQGQVLSMGMMLAGLVTFVVIGRKGRKQGAAGALR
jgi:phosphatidylglycerol:prolipoprotein diacylglycerol transferase